MTARKGPDADAAPQPAEGRTAAASGGADGTYTTVVPQTHGHLRLLTVGPVELNLDGMVVRVGGQVVHMAPKEFELFAMLLNNAGKVLTRRQLLDAIWGEGYQDTNKSLDVHIVRLRRHLKPFPEAYARMRTVRSIGYVFDVDL